MKKGDCSTFFNSQSAKVNILLLVSVVLIFVFSIFYAEALTITLKSPGNFTFNGTRNVNFTFIATWDGAGSAQENESNCTLQVNNTATKIVTFKNISLAANGTASQPDDRIYNASSNASSQLSYANITFENNIDGNFTWSVGCKSDNYTGSLIFTNTTNNFTFFLDVTTPNLTTITPNGTLTTNRQLNVTSNATAVFYVNVTDNSTNTVWVVFNSLPTVFSGGQTDSNETIGNTGVFINRTMTYDRSIGNSRLYNFTFIDLLNFSSNFTSPGPHGVFFCTNDSLNRRTCSQKYDFVVKGVMATAMEQQFSSTGNKIQHPEQGFTFSGLDIRYGNGTDLAGDAFMDPTTGNFTFNINFSTDQGVFIVGGKIDEGQFGNVSRTNYSGDVSTQASAAAGARDKANLTWVDIAKFIPSEVSYQFGIIAMRGTFGKVMYCNGTSSVNPNCFLINQCNGTAISIYNHSSSAINYNLIPNASACYLTSGSWGATADTPGVNIPSGFTYIFVDHFSGGLGSDDFGPPNATFNTPFISTNNNSLNFSSVISNQVINFTVDDTGSTGLNLSANNSINLTITLGGSVVAFFNYTNATDARLQCNSSDIIFPQNTTRIVCNATYTFLRNGTYTINITGRDTSNNSNPMNTTTNFLYLTVDQIPPRNFNLTDGQKLYYNFTHNSSWDTDVGHDQLAELGTSVGTSSAQGRSIVGVSNWSDNLTMPLRGLLQFFNQSADSNAGAWQTLNESPAPYLAYNNQSWTNFSYPIPKGNNEFEGRNVSFRIIANDTLGNINSSNSVKNFTIQVNDTTAPTILSVTLDISGISGERAANGTNTSDTTPTVVWNVTEPNALRYIAIQIDGTAPGGLCNKFVNYTITDGNVESNRNGSITVSGPDVGTGCPLGNGTRVVRVTAGDDWGNSELYIHSFTIQSGNAPGIVLATKSDGKAVINSTNITSRTGLNFTAFGNTVGIQNMSYISSCNSSAEVTFNNQTFIFPFNSTSDVECGTLSANRTLIVKVTDKAGTSNTTVFGFVVDNEGPSIVVHTPTASQIFTDIAVINISAFDSESEVQAATYFLDGGPKRFNLSNLSVTSSQTLTAAQGRNASFVNLTINFTPGRHTIKISVNDTLGNEQNTSDIILFVTGPINFGQLNWTGSGANATLGRYILNVSNVILTNASGDIINDTRTVTDQALNLLLALNATTRGINVTLVLNASLANWNSYNFSVLQNKTNVIGGIQNNQTLRVLDIVIFNSSVDNFVNDSGYYGKVKFILNASSTDIGSTVKVQWYENGSNFKNATNVSICSASFESTISGVTAPCWNNTDNRSIIVFVPHFSHVVLVNDTIPPTVSINIPSSTQDLNLISSVPNITVTDDTLNCTYSYNASGAQSSPISMTIAEDATTSSCIGGEITNLTNGTTAVNITFYVYDTSGNLNQTTLMFAVNDTTVYNVSSISISSVGSTGATVTIIANESVNMTINSTGSSSISSSSFSAVSTLAKSRNITFSSLTASTTYNFTVITCDRAGNCLTNITLGFTTSAAAASSTTSTTTSSSGGGGGVAAPSNVVDSAGRQWDTLAAGSSGVLTINKDSIAVVGVVIDVKNAVTSPSITVESLMANPYTAPAAAKVYQYLNLKKSNIVDSDASKITVKFKVAKSWLASNGVTEDKIVLYRYSDGKWNALPTSRTGADANYVLYESTTSGFSVFAVGSTEAPPVVTPPTEAVPTPETPSGEAAPPTEAPTEAPVVPPEAKKGLSRTAMAWIAVVIIVVVAALGYFMMQRKKQE